MNSLRYSRFVLFSKDNSGAATVEFVIVFPVMFFLFGFILLLAVDFFWMLTSQKAVERGAREAITRMPVAGALIDRGRVINYEIEGPVPAGVSCEPQGNCVAVPTYSCRGGPYIDANPAADCDVDRFGAIYEVVQTLVPNTIQPEDLTITYEDSGLGRASETFIPLVTVELRQSRLLGSFKWINSFFDVGSPTQPTVAAAFVGESMGH